MRRYPYLVLILLLSVVCMRDFPVDAATPGDVSGPEALSSHFLTEPSEAQPEKIGLEYLHGQAGSMGLSVSDLEELQVTDQHQSSQTGATHIYMRQHLGGIEIEGADISLTLDRNGRLATTKDRLHRGLTQKRSSVTPRLSGGEAILAAAEHIGFTVTGPLTQISATVDSPKQESVYAPAGISRDDIPLKLAYVIKDGQPRLCWNLVIRTPDGAHWWDLYVEANTGAVLKQSDWIAQENYRAYPLPLLGPGEGQRSLLIDPADAQASPFGWHGALSNTPPPYTDTRGNNVFAQEDTDADDTGGIRPDGGATLDFDFPLDLNLQPSGNLDASITNLFYLTNVIHDILYQYGFDEASGNFQQNNYGRGGQGSDAVVADTLDGASINNAQFGTPPDGFAPRMEMFRWTLGSSPSLIVTSPPSVAGSYPAGGALFGGTTTGLSGILIPALDAADVPGPSNTDACSPLSNPGQVSGNIALIDRGTCTFVTKVGHAQDAGAIGVIISNNADDSVITMSGTDPTLLIPALFIGQSDGATLAAETASGVNVNLVTARHLDSSLDASIIIHEYAHGLTNRLTGGPGNTSCLSSPQSSGMGEGWSDWLALVMTAMASDLASDSRGIATYLVGQPPDSRGIRNRPYNTDMSVNSFTFNDIKTLNQPHGVGEVWASSLWEVYWNYVTAYGFDPDLYTGTAGNNLALQLVIDGLKIQPCSPSFTDGRDALLTADALSSGGANQCLIWNAFAKRGIGLSATDGDGSNVNGVTEAFDLPVTCVPEPEGAVLLVSGCALLSLLARRRNKNALRT